MNGSVESDELVRGAILFAAHEWGLFVTTLAFDQYLLHGWFGRDHEWGLLNNCSIHFLLRALLVT